MLFIGVSIVVHQLSIYHPTLLGMDWLCPGYSTVLAKMLQEHHGNLTAEVTIRDVVSIVQTGDLHVAVYDLTKGIVYVANAKSDNESGPTYAYDRSETTASVHV